MSEIYVDTDGNRYRVVNAYSRRLGPDAPLMWFTERKRSRWLTEFKHKALPPRETLEQAKADLDALAITLGWKGYGAKESERIIATEIGEANERLSAGLGAAKTENRRLEKANARLEKEIENWKRTWRALVEVNCQLRESAAADPVVRATVKGVLAHFRRMEAEAASMPEPPEDS